jgi:hypothetical protein
VIRDNDKNRLVVVGTILSKMLDHIEEIHQSGSPPTYRKLLECSSRIETLIRESLIEMTIKDAEDIINANKEDVED